MIAVDDASGAVVVMGWAFDHSNLYTTVTAAVTLDGAIVTGASANLPSPYLYPYGVPRFARLLLGVHDEQRPP